MTRRRQRHEDVLRGAVEARHGVLLKARGEGDSTFSVFQRATDAVAAAIDAAAARRASRGRADAPIVCAWRCTRARQSNATATTTAAP